VEVEPPCPGAGRSAKSVASRVNRPVSGMRRFRTALASLALE